MAYEPSAVGVLTTIRLSATSAWTPLGTVSPLVTSPMLSPSGSESFCSTGTDTLRPGRTVTSSRTVYGALFWLDGAAMPTTTEAVALDPSRSLTE